MVGPGGSRVRVSNRVKMAFLYIAVLLGCRHMIAPKRINLNLISVYACIKAIVPLLFCCNARIDR